MIKFESGFSLRNLIVHHQNFNRLSQSIAKFTNDTGGKLGSNAKYLLVVKGLVDLGLALGTSFINILIWRETSNLSYVILFNLALNLFMLVSYAIPVFVIKIKKIWVLRWGIVVFILMFGALLLLKATSLNSILLIGTLYGLAEGLFWVANNTLVYENTEDGNRDTFFALDAAINNGLSLVSPIILGVIFLASINHHLTTLLGSYMYLFAITVIIFTSAFIFSFRIKSQYFEHLVMSDVGAVFKERIWKVILLREFIDGLREGSEAFIASLLLFFILANELNISLLNIGFSFISILLAFIMAIVLKRRNRLSLAAIGVILLLLSRIIYIHFFSVGGLIISASIEVLALPLFGLGLASTLFDAIDHSSINKSDHTKYIFVREIPLTAGRTLGLLILLFFVGLGSNLPILKNFYLALGVIPLVYFIFTYAFEQKFK